MEKDYKIEVSITEGNMVASLRVTPTGNRITPLDGESSFINESDLYEELTNAGVVFGISSEAVHRIVHDNLLDNWVAVAQGEYAGEGKDGYVKFHFSKERNRVRLKEDASGRVNFKEMNLIQNVKKGDVLCELIPPSPGKSGKTVKGGEVIGKLGAAAKLPPGKNIEPFDNGSKLIAAIDGMVTWVDPEVIIDPVYVVDKVDSSTGNIHFNGSVVVNGEVGDGFEIHAAEDVTIAMSVGRVIIESGGNIHIAGGILGQEMARLSAEGSIHVKFVQDAHLKAKKEIIAEDYIRSSEVTAGGPVIIKSQSGWISGGMVSSEAWIYCHTIGLQTHPVDTKLTIGHNPALYSERDQCEEDIIEKINDFLKLQASIGKLRAIKAQDQLTQPQIKLYEKILSAIETIKVRLDEHSARIQELTEKINAVFSGNIYVEGIANEGTRIMIGNASRELHHPRQQVQFSLNEGEIKESEFVMLPEIKNFLESE